MVLSTIVHQDLGFLWSRETRGSRIDWDLRGSYSFFVLVPWSLLIGRGSEREAPLSILMSWRVVHIKLYAHLKWAFFPLFTLSPNLTSAHQPVCFNFPHTSNFSALVREKSTCRTQNDIDKANFRCTADKKMFLFLKWFVVEISMTRTILDKGLAQLNDMAY